jgi:putative methyltransferase (TIGR04325 family)
VSVMKAQLGSVFRNVLPPMLPKLWRRVSRASDALSDHIKYSGAYHSWDAAVADSDGYDAPFILERVRSSMAKVRDGLAAYERDGLVFDRPEYSFPLLACLLRIASSASNRLRVLDFGGALGSTYFQSRPFFAGLAELRWNIVEQALFVECGQREFQAEHLRFFYSIDACLAEGPVDVVLISSVLPYLRHPHEQLATILGKRIAYLLLDRTPLVDSDGDRLTVQNVPACIYGEQVRYPAWLLGRRRLVAALARDYRLLVEFEALDPAIQLSPTSVAPFIGQLWQLKS